MNIESAEYTLNDGVPALRLLIDGKEALVCDVKPGLVAAGFVPLGSRELDVSWEALLPPVLVPAMPDLIERPLMLPGATDDKRVVAMAREFLDAIAQRNGRKFIPGPAPIPT